MNTVVNHTTMDGQNDMLNDVRTMLVMVQLIRLPLKSSKTIYSGNQL